MDTCDNRLLVANSGSDSIIVLDIVNNIAIDNIYLDNIVNKSCNIFSNRQVPLLGTHCMELNKKRNFLYLVNSFDSSVFKIDIKKMQIVNTVNVGSYPTHLQILDDKLIICNSDSNSISIVDEKDFTLVENVSVGFKPHDIKVDKNRNKVYVSNSNGYSISVVDLENSNIEIIKLCNHPLHLQICKDVMVILCSQTNGMKCSYISILDLNTHKILKRIPIENVILDMTAILEKNIIFITNISNGYIYKVDINKDNEIIKYYIGGMPSNLLWNGENTLYITDIERNLLLIFDIEKERVIKSVRVGIEPSGMVLLK